MGWREYFAREPFGFAADDVRHGVLCSVIAAAGGAELPPTKFMMSRPAEVLDVFAQLQQMLPDPKRPKVPPPPASTG